MSDGQLYICFTQLSSCAHKTQKFSYEFLQCLRIGQCFGQSDCFNAMVCDNCMHIKLPNIFFTVFVAMLSEGFYMRNVQQKQRHYLPFPTGSSCAVSRCEQQASDYIVQCKRVIAELKVTVCCQQCDSRCMCAGCKACYHKLCFPADQCPKCARLESRRVQQQLSQMQEDYND